MNDLTDQVEATIACGQCGHAVKKPVSWLTGNAEYVCPMCGETEDLSTPEWKTKIQTYIDACTDFDD